MRHSLAVMSSLLTLSIAFASNGMKGVNPDASGHEQELQDGSRNLGSVLVVESGFIQISADGVGMTGSSAPVQVNKPSDGATVRGAWLASASTGWSYATIADGCITLDGQAVNWDTVVAGPINNYNHWADVTDIVAGAVDPLPAGLIDLTLGECSYNCEGNALYVIFDDPATSVIQTCMIAFGAQSTTGDTFTLGFGAPIELEDDSVVELGLAISYGAQGQASCQNSYVDVNGMRLTSQAGHCDDGVFDNGALVTVGGIGDSRDNPADPWYGDPCVNYMTGDDDELYDAAGYMLNGDTQMTITTLNPSNDDNIFAMHMLVTFAAAINEGAVLTPANAMRFVGDTHTLTATLQDDDGNPVVGRDVIIDVYAGPHAGYTSGTLTTDGAGQVVWSYTGVAIGQDLALASFLDSMGDPTTSNTAVVYWDRIVEATEVPEAYALHGNHPNPFNPATTISFTLPQTTDVRISISDIKGTRVAVLMDGIAEAGNHELSFDASGLASGIYICTLTSEFGVLTTRMLLVK